MTTPFTLFISDLHLQSGREDANTLFERLTTEQAPQADALYILGDFFEYWIGDDDDHPFNHWVQSLLLELSQTTPVYIMEGNRDLMLGHQFIHQSGGQRLKDTTVIDLYGQPVLVTHGDRLCSDDWLHQWFRRVTSWAWVKQAFQWLPLAWRRRFAERMRCISRNHQKHLKAEAMDVAHEAVSQTMTQHGVATMIHGHTHQPAIHNHQGANGPLKRIVLGDWHDTAYILKASADGQQQLLHWPQQSC